MKNILIDLPHEPAALERLRKLPGVRVEVLGRQPPTELLRQQHVLACKQPPRNFDDLASLELLQLATVGYEHLRDLKLADRPFQVCNARGIFDTAIGEWNVAMMVNLMRDLRGMIWRQEHSVWERAERFAYEIRGRVVGLWGYGGIGRETARLAKALGLKVHVLVRHRIEPRRDTYVQPGTGDPEGALPDRVFTAGEELDFLGSLDFLVLALPRTQATNGMVGERELKALRSTAFVLNPARGPIIQEAALLQALRNGWIAGAALDTHYAYPLPADHPLWRFPNVILTPHVSGADQSPLFPERVWALTLENVQRHLDGRPLLNVVTKEELREMC